MHPRSRDSLFEHLPPPWPEDVLRLIQEKVRTQKRTVVVLDDDPTGTQTVYDIPVLTEWNVSSLEREFNQECPLFFILTNSRSMVPEQARQTGQEIGLHLKAAAQSTGRTFSVISRSDSTLRGHYPAEVDALTEALQMDQAVHLIIPFFLEGGRYTLEDVHWVETGDQLIPAGQTPFADDATFGYTASNLCEWVEEKTGGRIKASEVASLTVQEIRTGGPGAVASKLLGCLPRSVCIVNAASMRDLEVVALGCLEAEEQGKSLLYRTGASFVRAYAGLPERPLLTPETLNLPDEGAALVVVGSHVPVSTRQLNHLITRTDISPVELQVGTLLNPETRETEIERATALVRRHLQLGQDTVLYTSRELITGTSPADSLRIAGVISASLVEVVMRIEIRPRYIIAKGGITSSDVATRGLNVRRALVMGQILPGVPVNALGEESRFPGLAYIVFPGNVGEDDALTTTIHRLSRLHHE